MSSAIMMKSEIALSYQNAGVRFIIEIRPAGEGEKAEDKGETTLRISVKDASGEKDLTFSEDCSPLLADFTGGFVRWLSTLGITACCNGGEIEGSFNADYDVHKLIRAAGFICDMMEQRFSLYPDSILA